MATPLASSIRSISPSSYERVHRPVSVAIDIGTSSSGYAFAFREKGTEKLKEPVLNKWKLASLSSSTDKTPTCLLLRPDKTFHSFGYTAEDTYASLCDKKKQKGWWYFEMFKMLLYKTKLSRDATIKDAEDKPMSAHEVFVHAIAHLKERILNEVREQNSGIKDDGIQYVMTVPAIWSGAAKQFMREAATDSRVGIKDEQLTLVLEPEAASVYCRYTLSDTIDRPDGSVELASLPVGHKYVLADIGGGTVDIVSHEIIEHDKLREIYVARGDDIGGQLFNTLFLEFLESLFGHELFVKWKNSESGDYLTLLRTIEGLKWKIAQSKEEILLKIERSLMAIVKEDTDEGLDGLVRRCAFRASVDVIGKGKLSLSNGFLRRFFGKTLIGIDENIRAITDEHSDIGTIFFVGGLVKAPYIRDFIRARFPGQRLIAPEDPGVAVLRGAILLSDMPQTIAGRIARYTYGMNVHEPFEEGVHREDYRFTRDGEERCDNIFKNIIEKGQVLKYGQTFETTTFIEAKQPETKNQTICILLIQSTQASPMYTTEEGCKTLGQISMSPPEGGWPDHSKTTTLLIVGEAEFNLRVNILDKTYKQKIDFLFQ